MKIVGEVHEVGGTRSIDYEWRIANFFSYSKDDYDSPPFLIAGESYHLRIITQTTGEIDLYLFKNHLEPPITLTYAFWLKNINNVKLKEIKRTRTFNKDSNAYGIQVFTTISELLGKKSQLVPSNILTVVCTVEIDGSTDDADGTAQAECSYCKEALHVKDLSSHEDKCLDKPLKCSMCGAEIKIRKSFDHECLIARVKETEKLIGDFAAICKSQVYSDVTIKVKDQEFRLHRNILAGRNPFFHAMFSTEMTENNEGIISIEDCEPDIFEAFVDFLYTGKLEALSNDNVCSLYQVADKYLEDQLKAKCLSFMKCKLSVDNFCDFIALALRYDEKELLQRATSIFCKNTKEIICSAKWQTFLKNYPIQCNELHIKALEYNANMYE